MTGDDSWARQETARDLPFHRFDPKNCSPSRRRRGLTAGLVAGFAAGLLVASAAFALVQPAGRTVAAFDPRARSALADEWHQAQRTVASESFVRAPRR